MRTMSITLLCLSLVFYAGMSFAESEEICCTWLNTEYISGDPPQKLIFAFDGTFVTYNRAASTKALHRGTFHIVKKWKDTEQNVWYRIEMQNPKLGNRYKLVRLSKEKDKLEFVVRSAEFPKEINKKDKSYCNYTRVLEE